MAESNEIHRVDQEHRTANVNPSATISRAPFFVSPRPAPRTSRESPAKNAPHAPILIAPDPSQSFHIRRPRGRVAPRTPVALHRHVDLDSLPIIDAVDTPAQAFVGTSTALPHVMLNRESASSRSPTVSFQPTLHFRDTANMADTTVRPIDFDRRSSTPADVSSVMQHRVMNPNENAENSRLRNIRNPTCSSTGSRLQLSGNSIRERAVLPQINFDDAGMDEVTDLDAAEISDEGRDEGNVLPYASVPLPSRASRTENAVTFQDGTVPDDEGGSNIGYDNAQNNPQEIAKKLEGYNKSRTKGSTSP